MMMDENKGSIFTVALTGGPAGGKTTVQSMLSDVLENLGYKVYRVPETATLLLGCGVKFADLTEAQQRIFQENLLLCILRLEQTFFDLAQQNAANGINTVILCDRGAMDPSAYIERNMWMDIIKKLNLKEVEIRDNRYDIVVHLVTAAEGAELFYNSDNNATRSEPPALARHLDNLIKHAWIGHPYLTVIDNSTDFNQKCHRVVQAILDRMGLDDKRYGKNIRKHKYLVDSFPQDSEFPVPYRDFEVEHRYLVTSSPAQARLRKRSDASNTCHYNLTLRHPPKAGQCIEERRSLSAREYESLKLQMDPTRLPILKLRRCFLYNNAYFQLDKFNSAAPGLLLLEAYLADDQKEMLPPFIKVIREVTNEPEFSMFNLAKTQ